MRAAFNEYPLNYILVLFRSRPTAAEIWFPQKDNTHLAIPRRVDQTIYVSITRSPSPGNAENVSRPGTFKSSSNIQVDAAIINCASLITAIELAERNHEGVEGCGERVVEGARRTNGLLITIFDLQKEEG